RSTAATRTHAPYSGGGVFRPLRLRRPTAGQAVLRSGEKPEEAPHRVSRLRDRLELDVELRARHREPRGDLAEPRRRDARPVEMTLDASRDLGDPRRLLAERPARALDLAPGREPVQRGIRE